MSSTLPLGAQACHAVAFASVSVPNASWLEGSLTGAGGATAATRLDDSGRAAADLPWLVNVVVRNDDDTDTVHFTCTDPGAGAATVGVPVLPGTAQPLPLFGASTAPRVWLRASANTPAAVVLMSAAEG